MGEFTDAFSEGLEKFFSTVKSAAGVVVQKTKEGASLTRTGIQIQDEENKLKKLYAKLGIRTLINEGVDEAWEKELKGEFIPSREEILHEIKEHRTVILQLRQELQEAKGTQQTSSKAETRPVWEDVDAKDEMASDEFVVTDAPKESMFTEVIKPPMSDGVRIFNFCPSCHCGNIPNVKRCIYCGYLFHEK